MGVAPEPSDQEDKMLTVVLAALLGLAAARPQAVLPAGLSAAACPNYPFCGAEAPADFPTPVVNGEPIAPILNTNPAQTQFYQQSQEALDMVQEELDMVQELLVLVVLVLVGLVVLLESLFIQLKGQEVQLLVTSMVNSVLSNIPEKSFSVSANI